MPTLTTKEYNTLVRKSKSGWLFYYKEKQSHETLIEILLKEYGSKQVNSYLKQVEELLKEQKENPEN